MNVTFKIGEVVDDFIIKSQNGLSEFIAENEKYILCFRTDAGEGTNYSQVQWYTDKRTGRQYRAWRYLFKFIQPVQNMSNALFQRYKEENWEQCKHGHYDCIDCKVGVYEYLKERK